MLLDEEVFPIAEVGCAHFFAPELGGLTFDGGVGTDFAFGFDDPVGWAAVGVAGGGDEVGVVLAGAVVFVVGDGEAEAFVFEVAFDVGGAVEEVGELALEVAVAGDFVGGAFFAFGDEAGPLVTAKVGGVEVFGRAEDGDGADADGAPGATDGGFENIEDLLPPVIDADVADVAGGGYGDAAVVVTGDDFEEFIEGGADVDVLDCLRIGFFEQFGGGEEDGLE